MQPVIKFDSSKLVEITVFRLERIFQPLRALKSITGHMVYNPAYLKDDRDHLLGVIFGPLLKILAVK